jgi:hypothetical protein
MTLVKAETPPEDRLNQVRNYSQILHHCYLSLNVGRIIPEIN